MIARCISWRGVGVEAGLQKLWSRVAYATRYGGASLRESLALDQHDLQGYIEAVSEIVREENSASRK